MGVLLTASSPRPSVPCRAKDVGLSFQTVAGADFRYVVFRSRLPVGRIAKCSPQGASASGLPALGRFICPRHEVPSLVREITVTAALPFLKARCVGERLRVAVWNAVPLRFKCVSRSHVTRLTRPNGHLFASKKLDFRFSPLLVGPIVIHCLGLVNLMFQGDDGASEVETSPRVGLSVETRVWLVAEVLFRVNTRVPLPRSWEQSRHLSPVRGRSTREEESTLNLGTPRSSVRLCRGCAMGIAISELVCLQSELANSFGCRPEVPCKFVRLLRVVALFLRGTK